MLIPILIVIGFSLIPYGPKEPKDLPLIDLEGEVYETDSQHG